VSRQLRLTILALAVAACAPTSEGVLPPVATPPPHIFVDGVPRGPSVTARLVEIRQRVQDASQYPAISRERGISGETVVVFEIDDQGRPGSIAALQSSGNGALDRAAIRAVEDAGPYPVVYGRVRVPVRFAFSEPIAR
jgi:protein TonB